MNEKAAHMQDEESAKPEQDQYNSKNEEHEVTFFLEAGCRAVARILPFHMSRDAGDTLLGGEDWCERCGSSLSLYPAVFSAGFENLVRQGIDNKVAIRDFFYVHQLAVETDPAFGAARGNMAPL